MLTKQNLIYALSLVGLAVLALSAAWLVPTPAAPAPRAAARAIAPTSAPEQDMKNYAAWLGISEAEAQRRFDLQTAAQPLEGELTAHESATFAGLWVEHTPTFKIVVQFTAHGEETIAPYLKALNLADKGVVEVRPASVSLAVLERLQNELISIYQHAKIPTESDIDIKQGRVILVVAESDRPRLERAVQAAGLPYADHIDLITVPAMDTTPLYAQVTATPP